MKRYVWLGLVLAVVACGGMFGKPQGGGESHFLRDCRDTCADGLECISGVCTRSCLVGESSCADLEPSAICTDQSIEPGAVAVCDVACESAGECSGLGTSFICDAGFCRQPEPSPEPPEDAGAPDAADASVLDGGGEIDATSDAGPMPFPGEPCEVSAQSACLCADDPSDDCDANVVDGCPGNCVTPYRYPMCTGLGPIEPCPEPLSCVLDVGGYEGTDPWGLCVGPSLPCSSDADCVEGFVCLGEEVDGTGDCSPDVVSCGFPTCGPVADPIPCPGDYVHSEDFGEDGSSCYGPCVPITKCGCSIDSDCPPTTICDRVNGRCARPWQAAARCTLPFTPEDNCNAVVEAYAVVDGACAPITYGGCAANNNVFATLEECLATCEGKPAIDFCPEGRVRRWICVSCGQTGGCGAEIEACAAPCVTDEDCEGGLGCADDVCQVTACF